MRFVFVLKVVTVLCLMGLTPVLIRLVGVSSLALGTARLSLGLLLTLVAFNHRIALRRVLGCGSEGVRVPGRELWVLPTIGLCFGAHWYTYFESIRQSSASLGILALSTYGVHVTWMGVVFSKKQVTTRDWVSVLVSAVGAWICLPAVEDQANAFYGFLLGLLSAVFYAALPLLHKRVNHLNLPTRGTAQFFYAWLLFIPFAPAQDWDLSNRDWWIVGTLGVVCTFVAHNLWISVTTQVRPATSGLLYYLAIPVTMLLETVLVGDPPGASGWLGGGLIVVGNGYALWRNRTPTR